MDQPIQIIEGLGGLAALSWIEDLYSGDAPLNFALFRKNFDLDGNPPNCRDQANCLIIFIKKSIHATCPGSPPAVIDQKMDARFTKIDYTSPIGLMPNNALNCDRELTNKSTANFNKKVCA